jgi:hypothetical protein
VLGQVSGMRELLVAKHAERCEAIMAAVREEMRLLVACCRSIDVALDEAHEQYYRLLDSATRPDTDTGGAGGAAAAADDAEATRAACLRTETEPAATDYMQWMLETQQIYQQECNLKEQLVAQLLGYDDGAQVAAVRQAWQAQPFLARREETDADGVVTAGARVRYALAEAERAEEAAAGVAAAHTAS